MQGHGANPLSYGAAGPTINLDSLEDETCVASEKPMSEGKEMESEVDAHIWSEDVEHPMSSCTPRSCHQLSFLYS